MRSNVGDDSSGIAVYLGDTEFMREDDDEEIFFYSDVILIHQKGGNDFERLIDLEILFFKSFSIDTAMHPEDIKSIVKQVILVLNYDIPRFLRHISNIMFEEMTLGPYLIFYEKRKAFGNFMINPIEKKYRIRLPSPYYLLYDEESEAFSVSLPFRIINEEAYAPGGKEYEHVRRETKIGK